jgi:hypothetical protein
LRQRSNNARIRADCGPGRRYLPAAGALLAPALGDLLRRLDAGKIAADEALFAAIGSVITALASKIVLEKRIAPLRTQWRHFAQIWRVPKYVVTGSWEICGSTASGACSSTTRCGAARSRR